MTTITSSQIRHPRIAPHNEPNIFTPLPVMQIPHGDGPLGYNLYNPTLNTTGHGVSTGTIGYTLNPSDSALRQSTNLYHATGVANSEYKWRNPYGRNIPIVPFDAGCTKCHGTGVSKSSFIRFPIPCPTCYQKHGYCTKCYGTGLHYRKDKVCNKCR